MTLELIEPLAAHILDTQARIELMKQQEASLRCQRQELEATLAETRAKLLTVMQLAELQKFTNGRLVVSRRRTPLSVIVTDLDAVPDAFVEIVRKPKLRDITDAIRSGETVPGVALRNTGETVQIRRIEDGDQGAC